ncbi:HD domain-containing protein [Paraphysoderma sedebokerense]|nr:HD domain-containing protein [Paraphysoderma sedebokerense]
MSSQSSHNHASVLEFLNICENLKKTKRTGWINHGIPKAESIADHMHRMGLIAMLIQDPSLDRNKCIKMAIVHDLAEAVVGDLTPDCGISKEEKFKREKDAMHHFTSSLLSSTPQAQEMYSLWLEYEAGSTPEAQLIKDIDKFEMIVQAFEYEKEHKKELPSFWQSTKGKFKHPEIVSMVQELYKRRQKECGFMLE